MESTVAESALEKKKRASKPKVKTGCVTCKIRHVKCDETKPECVKCTSTGRKCDGYSEPKLPKAKAKRVSSKDNTTLSRSTTPERQLQLHLGNARERRALEFFFHRTAPQLSGFFSRSFWNGCVLQISAYEPTIRYAMVAVSAMYEDEGMVGFSPVAGTEGHAAFALESYNKAINSLVHVVKSNPESIRIPVMAAIIFVCLEFLRGHVDSALTHIESGVRMLKAWRENAFKDMISLPAESAFIEEELVPMFGWLNLLSSLFGRPSLDLYSFASSSTFKTGRFSPHEPAKSIEQAKTMLLDLVNATVKFIQSVGDAKYMNGVTMEMYAEQIRLQTFMNDWKTNFEYLQTHDPSTKDDQIKIGCNLLQAISTTMDIWLSAALNPNETAWDDFKNEFEDIVRLSGILVASSVRFPDELSKRFSFEMGIIPPLHFVAWKCRWPYIRRKALALLWTSPRRECLFESHRSFFCFQRVMEVEEEGLNLPPGVIPGPDQLPPEEARIHQVDIAAAEPTSEGYPISFLMKPNGLDGPWYSRTEIIRLGPVEFDHDLRNWLSASQAPIPEMNPDHGNSMGELSAGSSTAYHFTGMPVNGSDAIWSVGAWRAQDSLEAELHTRAVLLSSQQGIGTPDRLSDAGSSYFVAHSNAGTPAPYLEYSSSVSPPVTSTSLPFRSGDYFEQAK
ncbi:uncharacterized protein PV09_00114 [Verruconis gallopava]|uniref:Zn(2)-C6 fungal-type domain-containing protein n=1 Tax=Verruconis gallopava TaxID=253628 RepID=A0A0D2AR46_9PEZI|nr:uncharacterized protein PV09_00114 [Verruconis gallopava]KIW09183.1 hypothetical protein PV09_00114 [Verruconis gallopava]